MTYEQAAAFLAKGRNKKSRRLPGRSSEMRLLDNGDITIRYHYTDVVTLHANGQATLNSDGFRTVTTKARMNEYTNARIGQRGGLWYMRDGSLFYDGVTIDTDGKPLRPRKPERTEKTKGKLDKLVSGYVRAFRDQIAKDKQLPEPSAGDCWFCFMTVQSPSEHTGKSLGEANGDVGHILEHLKEKYVFGSILWRAVQRRGNPGFCWQYGNSQARQGRADFLMDDLRYYLRNLKPALLKLMEN